MSLLDLPPELVCEVFSYLDGPSIAHASFTCTWMYAILKCSESSILRRLSSMDPELLPEALLVAKARRFRDMLVIDPKWTRIRPKARYRLRPRKTFRFRTPHAFWRVKMREFTRENLASRKCHVTLGAVVKYLDEKARQVHSIVENFTARYTSEAPQKRPTSLPSTGPHTRQEVLRVQRAFYRVELHGILFSYTLPGSLPDSSPDWQTGWSVHWDLFFQYFSQWENEQLVAVYEFLTGAIHKQLNPECVCHATEELEGPSHGYCFVHAQALIRAGVEVVSKVIDVPFWPDWDDRFRDAISGWKVGPFLYLKHIMTRVYRVRLVDVKDGSGETRQTVTNASSLEEVTDRAAVRPFYQDKDIGPMSAWKCFNDRINNGHPSGEAEMQLARQWGVPFWDMRRLEKTNQLLHQAESLENGGGQ